jgi:hypothetical protein
MRRIAPLASLALLAPCLWCQTPAGRGQGSTLETLLAQLSEKSLKPGILFQIEAQPADPTTIPALEAAFDKRDAKQEKQWIACTLLRLGDKKDKYFDYLSSFVQQAIEDRAPQPLKIDSEGNAVKGEFSAEFENWCALNHRDPKQVAALQLGVYPMDMMILAMADDRRAGDLFLRGLDSPNPLVVAFSTQGLGRLGAASAIPLVEKACGRFPPAGRQVIAQHVPWLGGVESERLLERLVSNPALRDRFRFDVQSQQSLEQKRVLSREGRAAR